MAVVIVVTDVLDLGFLVLLGLDHAMHLGATMVSVCYGYSGFGLGGEHGYDGYGYDG